MSIIALKLTSATVSQYDLAGCLDSDHITGTARDCSVKG